MKIRNILSLVFGLLLILSISSCSTKEALMDEMIDEFEILMTEMATAVQSGDPIEMIKLEDKFKNSKLADFDMEDENLTVEQKIRIYEIVQKINALDF